MRCPVEQCTWSYEGLDGDDAIDAWEQHAQSECPQAPAKPQSDGGPDDPIGTVRAATGLLAVRAHSANPDYGEDLVWYVIDIGGQDDDLQPDRIEAMIVTWPIVYQP